MVRIPTALRGHIIGIILALKPRYVPGIHGGGGGGGALSHKHRTLFYSMRMKACAHGARTHGVVSNEISFLRSIK